MRQYYNDGGMTALMCIIKQTIIHKIISTHDELLFNCNVIIVCYTQ